MPTLLTAASQCLLCGAVQVLAYAKVPHSRSVSVLLQACECHELRLRCAAALSISTNMHQTAALIRGPRTIPQHHESLHVKGQFAAW